MMHVCFYVSLCRCELWAAHLYHMWWCCTRQRNGEHHQKHAAAYPHKNTHLLSNLLFECKRARGKPKLNWISSERLGVCLPACLPTCLHQQSSAHPPLLLNLRLLIITKHPICPPTLSPVRFSSLTRQVGRGVMKSPDQGERYLQAGEETTPWWWLIC